MSKAFTKENDDADDGLDLEPRSLPVGKNYITPRGFQKLRDEHHELMNVLRPDTVAVVSWAASNGDRSENGDYLYGKKRLREIDRKIRFLSKRLEIAEVIDPAMVKSDRVQFGATVVFADEANHQKTISIVGIDESEPAKGKVSWISPLAKVLLNQQSGDIVVFRSPKGEEELEILSIRYQEII
jgi:transcription elongation factor GreB